VLALVVRQSVGVCESVGVEAVAFTGDGAGVWDKNVIDGPSE
jgi:hypothetical protein